MVLSISHLVMPGWTTSSRHHRCYCTPPVVPVSLLIRPFRLFSVFRLLVDFAGQKCPPPLLDLGRMHTSGPWMTRWPSFDGIGQVKSPGLFWLLACLHTIHWITLYGLPSSSETRAPHASLLFWSSDGLVKCCPHE